MFDKWLKLPAHYYLRITAFTILLVGIALSKVLMSIGAIWILSNWIIEGKFNDYGRRFRKSPIAWMILLLFLFGLISLLWSEDVNYGVNDLRIKMPFIVIPVVMAISKPIDGKVFYYLLYVFLGIMLFTSIWNYVWYNFVCDDPNDIRKMSIFISHVRYSVLIDLGIFISIYLFIQNKLKKSLLLFCAIWFIFYTYRSQVLTGYVLFGILSVYTVYYLINKLKSGKLRVGLLIGFGLICFFGFYLVYRTLNTTSQGRAEVNYSQLEERSINGNPYYHDTSNFQRENGHHVWLYVCVEELKNEWNERAVIHYDSLDRKGQPMYGTLIRYLTSKNLRKDSVGVWSLSEDEIESIQNGHTSVNMNTSGIKGEISAFLEEYYTYKSGGDPNGHSILQRLEHFRIAIGIIHDHWLTGVGVGDVELAFQEEYQKMGTKLLPENQHRSHNQFFSIWISHGIFGLFLFIGVLVYPVISKKKPDYFLMMTIITLVVCCLFQDMLETQAGATIFGTFYAIAVFREDVG